MATILPLQPGDISTDPHLAADLGKTWYIEGTDWILLKASALLTAPFGKALLWDPVTSNNVSAIAGAAALSPTVACILPHEHTGNIPAGSYFLAVRNGWVNALYVGAAAAVTLVAVHATGGLDDATVTQPTAVGQTQVAIAGAGIGRTRIYLDAP
jgi:hypothetical protein